MTSIRSLIQPLLWRLYKLYLSKPRWYKFDGLEVRVLPSVFHPGLLGSTKVLYNYIKTLNLHEKYILELGAGSGLIALHCSEVGGIVYASDINPKSILSIQESCKRNNLEVKVIQSDLFDKIPRIKFDYIFINPPYYSGTPKTDREYAFYAGKDFDFFFKLFNQLSAYISKDSTILMVLSDNANISRLMSIAKSYGFLFENENTIWKFGEKQLVFRLIHKATLN